MTFVGPLMRTAGASEYIEATKQFLQMHRATRMVKQFENGNDVCSIYEMDIVTPASGLITLEVSDWIQEAGGRGQGKKSITIQGNLVTRLGWPDGTRKDGC